MNPCGTILVTNNFSLTHEAGESQAPSVSLRHVPRCPLSPALHKQTNYGHGYKLDPLSENAPSTFFCPCPSLLSADQLARQVRRVPAHALTRVYTQTCACAHCSVYSVHSLPQSFCLLSQLGFRHLYIPLITFSPHGIQLKKNLFSAFYTTTSPTLFSIPYLRETTRTILRWCLSNSYCH